MNFLAHVVLSGDNKELSIGNFIGDFVKGRHYTNLPNMVQKGVLLHRKIDDFTDQHPINVALRRTMHGQFRKYAGVYLDLYYDHFLSAFWRDFYPNISLRKFCAQFYLNAVLHYRLLPTKLREGLPSIIFHNRLQHYTTIKQLEEVFQIMSANTSLPPQSKEAVLFLEDNYEQLKAGFYEFFPLILEYTHTWRIENCKYVK